MATDNRRHSNGQVMPVKIIPTTRITVYRTAVIALLLLIACGITVLIGNQQQQWRELKEHRGEASKYFENEVLSCAYQRPHTHAAESILRYPTVVPTLAPSYMLQTYTMPNVVLVTPPKKQP